MRTVNKIFILIFALVFFFSMGACTKNSEKSVAIDETEIPVALPGRIVVLVVDISQSISNQLDDIIDGLCDKIIDERLESNDYCVIVPLGDSSNSDKADSFGIKYSTDKEKIKKYLQEMKSWMSGNLNTDIGAAIRKAFQYVNMIEEENDGNMLDPLVLFITDGEIYQSKNTTEKLMYETPDEIFKDPMMNPETVSYENWWFLGIENEGVPLVHIKSIAERTGAYPDRYETLSDMSQFGVLFDKWLVKIPSVKPKDNGRITFYDMKLGDKLLSSQSENYTVVPNSSDVFTWQMKSEYKINNVVMNFSDVKGYFQKDSTGEVIEFQIIPESGNIEFLPGTVRETRANVKIPVVTGKGRLKLTINTTLNAESEGQIPEYLFFIELKSPLALFIEKIAPFVIGFILVLLIFVGIKTVKERQPVKIKVEMVGKKTSKPRIASVRINREFEFGSKTGLTLRIEGSNIPPVVGKIVRTGKILWKIDPKDERFYVPNQKLNPYALGSSVKLILKDGSSCIIKFSKVR